jgi:hypothetical protein
MTLSPENRALWERFEGEVGEWCLTQDALNRLLDAARAEERAKVRNRRTSAARLHDPDAPF